MMVFLVEEPPAGIRGDRRHAAVTTAKASTSQTSFRRAPATARTDFQQRRQRRTPPGRAPAARGPGARRWWSTSSRTPQQSLLLPTSYTVPVRLVFAGTPEPALPALKGLIDSPRHDVVAVLTRPDAASGRHGKLQPSPVARLALEHGIPVLRPPRPDSDEFVAEFPSCSPTAARWSRSARCCATRCWRCRRAAGSICTFRCCPPGAERLRFRRRSPRGTPSPVRRRSRSNPVWTPGLSTVW